MARPDYMMLTLSSPASHNFDYKPAHEFAVHRSAAILPLLSTPPPERSATHSYLSSSAKLPSSQQSSSTTMTAPHRGLPPPAPLTLPDPSRLPAPIPGQSHSTLPAPPPQWHGMEDPMKNWLATKLEEEKRKQEEEKTQQESLRLEQKKIEQNMLSDVIRSGYPPTLVPMLFMALGGTLAGTGNSAAGMELLQQYLGQFVSQQQTQPPSPEAARERLMTHSQPVAYPGPQSVPPTPLSGPYGGYSAARGGPGSGPPSSQRTHFPAVMHRLSTVESTSSNPGHQPTPQPEPQSSILFHHWQPPASQGEGSGGGIQPTVTPSDYSSSPKKRKAPGSHLSNPPPSSALRFSEGSRSPRRQTTSHSRQRSDMSTRGAAMSQPEERPSFSRPRAGTLTTEHSSAGSESQWQPHRYGSQQPPQLRGQPPEAHSESPSRGSYEERSRRSSQVIGSNSTTRTPATDERPISSGDVEMIER